ncbi:thiamine pyrophosphate-binding protein [Streptomyces sp. NL15-2K]|uniref:thiamine pyrophosphate-binding protein n=1 Tax=Streptomyces sp. NL15-2K TaxID=376149 RepID=UPI000F57F8E9|nr:MULTISPECIES: thiamine pyrophosphate-binding protein [Actinomycetes]WKX10503.1 thiamine pyrophosphate-binding protein [Kutzneria buriramensis]GCB47963.1 sulfopyruvate decarboxylase - alpha subunit [Streptomyces sp. NL15-2K]
MTGPGPQPSLQSRLADALVESGYRRAYGVPDSVLAPLLRQTEQHIPLTHMPREDLAVGAAVGACLGGETAFVFMKNAGLGNSIDALLSLARASQVPVSIVMGMSGTGGDTLPHHVAVGERASAVLRAVGIRQRTLTPVEEPRSLAHWLHRNWMSRTSAAVLIPPG